MPPDCLLRSLWLKYALHTGYTCQVTPHVTDEKKNQTTTETKSDETGIKTGRLQLTVNIFSKVSQERLVHRELLTSFSSIARGCY